MLIRVESVGRDRVEQCQNGSRQVKRGWENVRGEHGVETEAVKKIFMSLRRNLETGRD